MASEVFVEATFDPGGARIQTRLFHDLRIIQEEERHEIAVLDMVASQDATPEFSTGAPVHIAYGRRPDQYENFYGYVWSTQPGYDPYLPPVKRHTQVICLGSSSRMKDPIARSFVNQTSTSVARQILQLYKFSADFVESSFIWPSINSPGYTAWELLKCLADREGWTFWAKNTDLKFFPRLTLLQRPSSPILSFYFKDAQPKSAPVPNPTITEFHPMAGDANNKPGSTKVTRLAFGVDPRSGQSLMAQSIALDSQVGLGAQSASPLFDHVLSDMVAESPAQVTQRVAAADEKNRFYIQATAKLLGDHRLTQGMVIILEGLGPKYSGYWYVHKVVHHLIPQKYMMEVQLGRDGIFDQGTRLPQVRGSVFNRYNPYGSVVSKQPGTVLINDTWVSTWIPQPQAV